MKEETRKTKCTCLVLAGPHCTAPGAVRSAAPDSSLALCTVAPSVAAFHSTSAPALGAAVDSAAPG